MGGPARDAGEAAAALGSVFCKVEIASQACSWGNLGTPQQSLVSVSRRAPAWAAGRPHTRHARSATEGAHRAPGAGRAAPPSGLAVVAGRGPDGARAPRGGPRGGPGAGRRALSPGFRTGWTMSPFLHLVSMRSSFWASYRLRPSCSCSCREYCGEQTEGRPRPGAQHPRPGRRAPPPGSGLPFL